MIKHQRDRKTTRYKIFDLRVRIPYVITLRNMTRMPNSSVE